MTQDLTPIDVRPADAVPAERLHAAFGAAFADYLIGPFQLSPAQWPGFLARQGVELGLSRVAVRQGVGEGEILAFALTAPRPGIGRWRLGTMGATPAARGSGAAPALLDDFIARARKAGMAAVELEVFAQNERARRLYEGRGFALLHELHGYLAEPGSVPAQAHAVQQVTQAEALAWLDALALPDLPLQVTPAILGQSALQAWRHGQAQLLFSLPDEAHVQIVSLVDTGPAQADARALLQTLAAEFPQRRLRVPQLQRLDLGGRALRELGFALQPLHQWLMWRPLSA
ncbi:GNAT family N-acetyltransferase [Paucibacter sediminis]|uniref:GNAT family N-acetyltransferase n=1 Tax=Paucibacter sediminis TaxID=3019553 RepID=A0AA95ND97_9BURK|nr:GNAT family N-acetyltransferase [Paucibacter sp. S2-9]WIT12927.1 GNAT family N-acetyltransferase [Paucibacter sp. S2-9]